MNVRSIAMYQFARFRPRSLFAETKRNVAIRDLRWISPNATYIICTNPRSGSWLFSEGLTSTSLAGKPREWFNTQEEQRHRALWRMEHSTDLSYETYLRLARVESTTRNGVSGVKLHYYQFAELPKKLNAREELRGLNAAQVIARLFPRAKYIWLTRRDKARQAISFFIASRTGRWWAIDGAMLDRREGATDPDFDPTAITRLEQLLVKNDLKWQAFFEENQIVPLVIHYEDLLADYAGTIVNVLKWLGIPDADLIRPSQTRLRQQSNARNEEWLGRYKAFKREVGNLESNSPRAQTDGLPLDPMHEAISAIPSAWKQWVAHSKILKTTDDAIVDVLVSNGYNRAAAMIEVKQASSHPYVLGAVRTHRQLNKAASLLKAQGELARLNSQSKVIERRRNLSRDEFRDDYYSANRPVILEGLMDDWRAVRVWTREYLKSVAGDQIIEVMTDRKSDSQYEANAQKHRTEMRFADYIDMVYSGRVTNDYYMVANNAFFQRPEARPLLDDFAPFLEYLDSKVSARQCFFWFGPAGTVTPLHHDTSNILLAQVTGRKRFRVIPVSQWDRVYNRKGVFSDVDCERPDLTRHPKFREATVIDVVLKPGEVLFIPVGWWHHVRALDVSITVSFTNFIFSNHFTWR